MQDLITALSAANGSPPAFGVRAETAVRAPGISFPGQAEGLPSAATFQEVVRVADGRRVSRHLIFYEDDGESASLTFGALLEGAEHVAADLRNGASVAAILWL